MNRRHFLRLSATAAALGPAAVLPVACASGRSLRRDVRLSAASLMFKELTLEQVCARIAGVGYEAIDIWGEQEGCPHLEDVAQRLGGSGLRELLERHQLQLYALTLPASAFDRYAGLIRESTGALAVRESAEPAAPEGLRERVRVLIESLKPHADLVGQHQGWLAVAHQTGGLLNSLDSLKAFTDMNSHPRLGIALAPHHLQAVGVSVPEAIRTAGEQLLMVYAWQDAPGLQQLPGYGPTDFRPWLDALESVNYRWYLNTCMRGYVEPDTLSSALARSRNYLLHPA
jgi:sugar phosphate isomerase/epimerase